MNDDMRDYWNADAGNTWADMQARMDLALTPVTAALFDLARPQPGERVLDIGCGTGETTLALAAAVGDDGDALGVDISQPMLAVAEARAEALDSLAEFRDADAATLPGAADRDLILSRFGVMFFDDPAAAFANIRSHAAPGARLCFACWRTPAENGWATMAMDAVADLLPPAPPADPHAPGPFAFADPARIEQILEAAGWSDIALHAHDFGMAVGQGDDPLGDAVDFSLRIGPAARAVREGGPEVVAAAREALARLYAGHVTDDTVSLPAAIWLVSARHIE
ncbi:class I SAM-dependent methyltransferase [Polymorphobacter sp.]|uniref:class I SAM-dependent methyltransferase n=1 Tax=Polymorphobacter sp. TaxID=1909290 RepID=UPI003F6FB861